MNIASILDEQARRRGNETAIADVRRSLTFSQLNDAAACAAEDLASAGLRAGDRALLFCPMSIELYVTLIGLFRVGATAVFVDPGAGARHVAACCERLQPRGFVAVRRAHLLRLISRGIRSVPVKLAIGGGVPGTRTVAQRCITRSTTDRGIVHRNPEDAALITFTSGSTGEPKVAVRTHAFLVAQHRVLAEQLELRAGDVDLTTLPMFALANLASGATTLIPDVDVRAPGAIDAVRLMKQIRSARPGRMAASPALLERLAAHLEDAGEQLDVRRIYTGGAPVFPGLLDRLAAVAPRASIGAVYGSTEAEPIAHLQHAPIAERDRAVLRTGAGLLAGTPVPAIDLRIIPDRWGHSLDPYDPRAFDDEALPAGEPGEIVVAGPHVLSGYLGGCGDDETKIRVGGRIWHRTGDAGYLDTSGRLWLLGRCSEKVSDSRGTLYPLAVECAAAEVPGVRRSAFVQHRSRRLLVAELHDPASSLLLGALRLRLRWAQLDDVLAVPRIPVDRRHNAKVDYPALDRLLSARFA